MTRAGRLAVLLAALCAGPVQGGGEVTPPCEVSIGFGGVYRTGSWTPLSVEFPQAASAPTMVYAWTEDPDGQFVRSPAAPVEATADGRSRARLVVRFGRPVGRVRLEMAVGPSTAESHEHKAVHERLLPPPLPAAENMMLVLGDLPAAERCSRLLAREDGSRPRVVAVDNAATSLGWTARDFDGADAIVICGAAVAGCDPAALRGIDEWVRCGGRLVFLSGESAVDVQAGDTAAGGWLPGPIERLVPLRRGSALEAYARASRPLDKSAFAALRMPLLRNPRAIDGSVEAFEGRGPGDQPLVVRRAHGLGTIAWIGVDLDRPPFRNWSGSDSLLVELLGGRATKDSGRSAEGQRSAFDLASQLRQAIDRFPGVAPLPFEVIAGLGALYVACLYPLDWWLASRGGMRRGGRLAWISLPMLVVACSGLAWAAGQRWKGDEWRTSAAEVVDLDVPGAMLRARAYAGIWSPLNARLDVCAAIEGDTLTLATDPKGIRSLDHVSWFAASGRGIGGTDAPSPHPSLATADYRYAVLEPFGSGVGSVEGLEGVPIAASSSRLFEAQCAARLSARPVETTLVREGQGTLRGTVTNRLPFVLEECVLAHAGWLYEIGRLESGGAYDIASGKGPRSLAGALTRRTTSRDREISSRWNLAESDPWRILEIAGFHAAAGGAGYTGLAAGRLGRMDLSPLLPLDRAVLVGRGPRLVGWHCSADVGGVAAIPPFAAGASLWRIVISLTPPSLSISRDVPEAPRGASP